MSSGCILLLLDKNLLNNGLARVPSKEEWQITPDFVILCLRDCGYCTIQLIFEAPKKSFSFLYFTNLLLTEHEVCTGEYAQGFGSTDQAQWGLSKLTEGQYFPVWLEQVRLVSGSLYGTCWLSRNKIHGLLLTMETVYMAKSKPRKNQLECSDLSQDCLTM